MHRSEHRLQCELPIDSIEFVVHPGWNRSTELLQKRLAYLEQLGMRSSIIVLFHGGARSMFREGYSKLYDFLLRENANMLNYHFPMVHGSRGGQYRTRALLDLKSELQAVSSALSESTQLNIWGENTSQCVYSTRIMLNGLVTKSDIHLKDDLSLDAPSILKMYGQGRAK